MENAQLNESKVRGRPRKSVDPHDPTATPKRKRGRPRKDSFTDDQRSGAQVLKTPKMKRSRNVSMVEDDGTPFSPAIYQVLSRLDERTLSKSVRECVLGIVRDVIKITRASYELNGGSFTDVIFPTILNQSKVDGQLFELSKDDAIDPDLVNVDFQLDDISLDASPFLEFSCPTDLLDFTPDPFNLEFAVLCPLPTTPPDCTQDDHTN
ncbi:hypothetical protein CROQUDRAFT_88494 [Cronartium quercuum f. sp. fusiforme G11]|uniref:Uncharacterized protein n=1 Tax=Cronartium quercuum f. sp. fusiforme G11 TaxID=708437 RepID=A0A9P6TEU8_9BASI|nr:hypothetical protein CROQUDRAFT_88494 [Cronartium quercuum f. sp. fusiforme G11]